MLVTIREPSPNGSRNEALSRAFLSVANRRLLAMPSISSRCCRATAALIAVTTIPDFAAAQSVLAPAGPVGAQERVILLDSLAIMLAIVIPTMAATLACVWWFRASNTRAIHMPDWNYSGKLELLVWSIPTLAILFLGGLIWASSHDLDPSQPLTSNVPPLQVQVVALDWKWLFIYPQQNVASVNELIVPAGTPLHFEITSATVFNVFFVPRLGSEIYAMHGMMTQLNLQADRPGNYLGLSAQFSGDGFAGMHFEVNSMSPAQFERWIAAARSNGPQLDDAAYRGLLRQSQNVRPYTYRAVQPGLFGRVVTQNLPPGEGPPLNTPNSNVRPFGGK
ncbi:MAG TPA: ubiquinol oxidase subunit II [Micropepsaceae bacterium]|nr:ubiquinol oxidase subunit II [Micropepsaceae bacterium]